MEFKEVMSILKKNGTAQNRKIYARHGGTGKIYGVPFSIMNKLWKKIKIDCDLALQLWDTGIMDARTLAMMVHDPERVTSKQWDEYVKQIGFTMITHYLAGTVAKSKHAIPKMKKWMKSKDEIIKQAGYTVLCSLLKNKHPFTNKELTDIIKVIEKEIHASPNRARDRMNTALVAIGMFNPALQKKALAAAKRIGKVEIDHGETSCSHYDAVKSLETGKCVRIRK